MVTTVTVTAVTVLGKNIAMGQGAENDSAQVSNRLAWLVQETKEDCYAAQWFLDNLHQAQLHDTLCISLKLEWHDELTEDLQLLLRHNLQIETQAEVECQAGESVPFIVLKLLSRLLLERRGSADHVKADAHIFPQPTLHAQGSLNT